MADAIALRRALAELPSPERYRKFVLHNVRKGQLRYWQERIWEQFIKEHPEFDIPLEELERVLCICHVHGDELQHDSIPVFHGHLDYAPKYAKAKAELFPYAWVDQYSTEGSPFVGNWADVLYCETCRKVAKGWHS